MELYKIVLTITEYGASLNVGEIYGTALALGFPFCLVAIASSSQSRLIRNSGPRLPICKDQVLISPRCKPFSREISRFEKRSYFE